jgi:AcrR family transcriptional regulator
MVIFGPQLAPVNTLRYGGDMVKDKMSKEAWFDAGFRRLAAQGPQGLKIMAIAEDMGVTKGSFYWHFKDLREYRTALLAEWERRFTEEIIQQSTNINGDIATKMHTAIRAAEGVSDRRLLLVMRTWALHDPLVAKALAHADKLRVSYMASLFRELGWGKNEASTMAGFVYSAFMGRMLWVDGPLSTSQREFLLRMFTPK